MNAAYDDIREENDDDNNKLTPTSLLSICNAIKKLIDLADVYAHSFPSYDKHKKYLISL